ncbi:MAG: RES family NAD+ phosphorylase [Thermoanaerobaculia bacterium]
MSVWLISRFTALDGRGGLIASGRWHHAGRPIVYTAETPAGAIVEYRVHLEIDPEDIPRDAKLLCIDLPRGVLIAEIGELARGWQDDESMTRALGDEWLRSGESPALRLPSAVVPHEWNVLLDPLHPTLRGMEPARVEPYVPDLRLFRNAPRR